MTNPTSGFSATQHPETMQIVSSNIPKSQKSNLMVISDKVKLCVFVPLSATEKMLKLIGEFGGGVIGNYTFCSFCTEGKARYVELTQSQIEEGSKGSFSQLITKNEVRIETVVPIHLVEQLIKEIKAAHPYKEVQPDVIPMLKFVSKL